MGTKLISKCFNNVFIILITTCFLVPASLLLIYLTFFVVFECQLNIFGFWTLGQNITFALENCEVVFPSFLHFLERKMN